MSSLERPVIPVAALPADARATFITRTYLHLYGAVLAFTLFEVGRVHERPGACPSPAVFLSVSWLWILGGFVVVSWLASRVAQTAVSPAAQYLALAGYVVAQGLIFVPMLLIAQFMAPGTIQGAAFLTLFGFTALTVIVFATRRGLLVPAPRPGLGRHHGPRAHRGRRDVRIPARDLLLAGHRRRWPAPRSCTTRQR